MSNPTLGGVELTTDTTWMDRYGEWSPVAMVHETDIHGLPVFQVSPARQGGEAVTLLVRNCTKPTLDALRALSEASVGEDVVLEYHGESVVVKFSFVEKHAVQGVPLRELPRYDVIGEGVPFWTVTVSLITV